MSNTRSETLIRPQTAAGKVATGAMPAITGESPKPDGIRDTIESIVVAFILAFVFRAFVVEAFVIPTGSMAPVLYGKHVPHRCAVCSFPFAYGIREPTIAPDGRRQDGTLEVPGGFSVRCPNCGWIGEGNARLNTSEERRVVADSGDRILVLKWSYDVGGKLLGPKRWDVIVFKDPQDGDTNYIKRLVGLPGEVLEIIDGDLYTAPSSEVPDDIRQDLSVPPPPGNREFRRLSVEQQLRLAKLLHIQRKTRVAQESLWIIHYDNDYRPDPHAVEKSPGFIPPVWRPLGGETDSDWDTSSPLVKFSPKSNRPQWLELAGKPITDGYGYNDVIFQRGLQQQVFVGDVRMRFSLLPTETRTGTSKADMGLLTMLLGKGADQFVATIAADGDVLLERIGDRGIRRRIGQPVKIEPLLIGRPVEIEFENLDYRVALRIDHQEVIATTDAEYAPDLPKLLERPYRDSRNDQATLRIGAKNLPLEILHLAVHRDVYYRSDCELDERLASGKISPFARYPGWGTATNPILLRADPPDYFGCGDNSPQSKDARMWSDVAPILEHRGDYQFGTIPGDQLIGRAFFVYWPSGFRFSQDTPGVIPNFGRMRIIR